MDSVSKPVAIMIGGRKWYYQSFSEDGKNIYRLYDSNGDFLREFFEVEDMTEYVVKESSNGKNKTREKMQECFMRRIEELKGEMSDARFAACCNLKYESCYQYLTGRRFPTVIALAQIADAFGVTVDWLIGREE